MPSDDELPGRGIVVASWFADAVFAGTAVPNALGVDAFETAAIVVELVLFFLSIAVWLWAFATAVVRNAQGEEIVVGNLFLVQGDVPRAIRVHLFGALVVAVVIAGGSAGADPFGILVTMLPLGFIGLWGARHGTFPARRDTAG